MPVLLLVHHTTSPALHELLAAVRTGTQADGIEGVEVRVRAALTAGPVDVLAADGVVLGTPANIGYMSGALKHFFDQIYYPCLDQTQGLPYATYVHGSTDVTGAVRSIEGIATGLAWRRTALPVTVVGPPGRPDLDRCWELGASLAAALAEGAESTAQNSTASRSCPHPH
jgi:hypothetical protein